MEDADPHPGGKKRRKFPQIAENFNIRFFLQNSYYEKSLKICKSWFEIVFSSGRFCIHNYMIQSILCTGNKERWTKVLALIPDDDLRQEIEKSMEHCKSGVDR